MDSNLYPGARRGTWFATLLAMLLGGASLSPARAAEPAAATPPAATPPVAVTTTAAPNDPLRYDFAGGHIKLGIEAGIQIVGESRAFWNLSKVFAPTSGFKTTFGWGEAYIKPGLSFERLLGADATAYGALSTVGARTLGGDIFDSRDKGRFLLENAYLGLKYRQPGQGFFFDLSGGAQPYRIGSGMLIADGAQDGFERGALIFGPRQAWSMTGIARLGYGPVSLEGFYLDANEYASNDMKTTLAGANLVYAPGKNRMLGLTFGKVLTSLAPYAQAAPGGIGPFTILNEARKDLAFLNAYGRWTPVPSLPGLWIAGDFAYQWQDRIDLRAWAARAEIGYAFTNLPFAPTLSYAFQTFSGDDPNTRRLERFDPLFYDGSPNGWATGYNGSFVFINSNVSAHRVTLALYLSPRDILTLRYAHVRANELNSPIQFGQGTRLTLAGGSPGLIAGVRKHHLSDDVLAEYTRVLTPNAFFTVGIGYSEPGSGLKDTGPGRVKGWTGAFANLVVRY